MLGFPFFSKALTVFLAMLLLTGAAVADEWVAVKLRGGVFEFTGGDWRVLERGATVPDERVIRTMRDGRVEFRRGAETIDMGPDTQIRIYEQPGRKFTIVQQHFGEVAVEAEKRDIQHFAVQTEYVAAVVKGTRFTVRSGSGHAYVSVDRGEVEVRDVARSLVVRVRPGQQAGAGEDARDVLTISGRGDLDQVAAYRGNPVAATVVVDRSPAALAEVAQAVNAVKTGADVSGADVKALPPGLARKITEDVAPGSSGNAASSNAGLNSNAGGNGIGKAKGLVKDVSSTVKGTVSSATDGATDVVNDLVSGATSPGNSNGAGNRENSNAGSKGKELDQVVNGLLN